jgi:hypothetical protein
MVAGLRSLAKAMELPPAPTVRAPAPDPTLWGGAGNGSSLTQTPRQSLTRQRLFAWLHNYRRVVTRWESTRQISLAWSNSRAFWSC